jgi:hypothetical protein
MANWSEGSEQWTYERTLGEIHYGEGYAESLISLTADELTIFWQSARPDGTGAIDIWTASRSTTDQPFGNIRELSELNTVNNDGGPCISPDGLTLFFNCMYRAGGDEGTTGIYKTTRSSLSDPFGNVELVAIPDYETRWEHHPYVDFERNSLYFQHLSAGGISVTTFEPDPALYPLRNTCLSSDGLILYGSRMHEDIRHVVEFRRGSLSS